MNPENGVLGGKRRQRIHWPTRLAAEEAMEATGTHQGVARSGFSRGDVVVGLVLVTGSHLAAGGDVEEKEGEGGGGASDGHDYQAQSVDSRLIDSGARGLAVARASWQDRRVRPGVGRVWRGRGSRVANDRQWCCRKGLCRAKGSWLLAAVDVSRAREAEREGSPGGEAATRRQRGGEPRQKLQREEQRKMQMAGEASRGQGRATGLGEGGGRRLRARMDGLPPLGGPVAPCLARRRPPVGGGLGRRRLSPRARAPLKEVNTGAATGPRDGRRAAADGTVCGPRVRTELEDPI